MQLGDFAEQAELNCQTLLTKDPGRHESVTAVVAWSGENDDWPLPRRPLPDDIGHGSSSIFHQRDRWYAARYREPVSLRHLFCSQKFVHGS